MIWRLASTGNISWRLASTKLEAFASTGYFDVASGGQRKHFPVSGVYKRARKGPRGSFFVNPSKLKQFRVCMFVSNTRMIVLGTGKTFSKRGLEDRVLENLVTGP